MLLNFALKLMRPECKVQHCSAHLSSVGNVCHLSQSAAECDMTLRQTLPTSKERLLVQFNILGLKHKHTHTHDWPPHAYTVHRTLAPHLPRLFFRKPSGSAPDIIDDLVNEHLTTCEAHIKSRPVALIAQPWVKRREWKDVMGVKRGDN